MKNVNIFFEHGGKSGVSIDEIYQGNALFVRQMQAMSLARTHKFWLSQNFFVLDDNMKIKCGKQDDIIFRND